MKVNTRLVFAIFSTLLEETALVSIVLWGLPRLGVNIPLGGLIAIVMVLTTYDVISYRIGSRALKRKPVVGQGTMVGAKGRVVTPLAPEGFIRVGSDLRKASSADKGIGIDDEVTVVSQERLKLIVRKSDADEHKETEA